MAEILVVYFVHAAHQILYGRDCVTLRVKKREYMAGIVRGCAS